MRVRIILLSFQCYEAAQQLRVIKSWQGLVGHIVTLLVPGATSQEEFDFSAVE
jgi:hypothetical protein